MTHHNPPRIMHGTPACDVKQATGTNTCHSHRTSCHLSHKTRGFLHRQ